MRRPIAKIVLGAVPVMVFLGHSAAMSVPENVPIPKPRPVLTPGTEEFDAGPSMETTGSINRAENPTARSGALKKGLDALTADKFETVFSVRDSMVPGSLDRMVLTWAIATSGARSIPSAEIAAAATELRGWPGLETLRPLSERALYRENPSPGEVLDAFGSTEPETREGSIILARALLDNGDRQRATSIIASLWREDRLDAGTEKLILKEFSSLLKRADHKRRMDMLLYRDRVTQADRVDGLAGAESLFKARAAVSKRSGNAGKLLSAVHESWHSDPGYIFSNAQFLRRSEKYREAAQWLLKAPRDRQALVDEREWWIEQRIVSRALAEQDDYKLAYRVASLGLSQRSGDVVDGEWHAGWFALRGLDDAAAASRHFEAALAQSTLPISLARSYYWLGRAAEQAGDSKADNHFRRAASYQMTYYGQLAAVRLGRQSIDIPYPEPTPTDRHLFESRLPVTAIKRLQETGHEHRARKLYFALAETLTNPGEIAMLSAMAENQGDHRLSLQVGKKALARGIDVAALAFPVGVIPDKANIDAAGKALAYAVARQESAFDPSAVSGANAQGLLQLLPSTAKQVASRHGLSYSKSRLTTDPGYNATLGSHYLGQHIANFNGSYVLTFVAYNAGPGRSRDWIERLGDPRGIPVDDVVDWVESIPFTETRNYVQRVMENYQVYKTRLGGQADIVGDLRHGRKAD